MQVIDTISLSNDVGIHYVHEDTVGLNYGGLVNRGVVFRLRLRRNKDN